VGFSPAGPGQPYKAALRCTVVCIACEHMQVEPIKQGPRARKQRGPVNWVDVLLAFEEWHGFAATNEGVFLNPVASGGALAEPGRTVGRVYTMTSVELRMNIGTLDPADISENNRIMTAADAYEIVGIGPPTAWVSGTGPDVPITVQVAEIRYPAIEDMGYIPPFRLVLVHDSEPFRAASSGLTWIEVCNFNGFAIEATGGSVLPYDEDERNRFTIIWEEVFNPAQQYQLLVNRTLVFKDLIGKNINVINKLNNQSSNVGCLTGGLWLFGVSCTNPADEIYPSCLQGTSRVFYFEG